MARHKKSGYNAPYAKMMRKKQDTRVERSIIRSLFIFMLAIHNALGIGVLRLTRDIMPEFDRLNSRYASFIRSDGNREYADIWLANELKSAYGEDFTVDVEKYDIPYEVD